MKITVTILRGPGKKAIKVETREMDVPSLSVQRKLLWAENTLNSVLPGLRFHIDTVE